MFSEVLHGLIGRTQRSAGVDQNHPRAVLVPSSLRIGIIPAGTEPAWRSLFSSLPSLGIVLHEQPPRTLHPIILSLVRTDFLPLGPLLGRHR